MKKYVEKLRNKVDFFMWKSMIKVYNWLFLHQMKRKYESHDRKLYVFEKLINRGCYFVETEKKDTYRLKYEHTDVSLKEARELADKYNTVMDNSSLFEWVDGEPKEII